MTPTIEANSGYDSGLCGVIGGFFVCSVVLVHSTTNKLTSNQNSHYWFFIYLVRFYYTTKMILTCTFFTPLVKVHNSYFNVILLVLQRGSGITSVITSLSNNS